MTDHLQLERITARIRTTFERQTFMSHVGAELLRVGHGLVEISVRRNRRCCSNTASCKN